MAGQPPFYNSPEELENKIEEYYKSLQYSEQNGNDFPIKKHHPCTITGLAYYLGFESRQSFYDYEKRSEYSYIIKRARLFVESHYEANLSRINATGSIFALKNMGWKDEQYNKNENFQIPAIVKSEEEHDSPKLEV